MNADQLKSEIDGRFARVILGPQSALSLCGRPFVTVTSGGVAEREGGQTPRASLRAERDHAILALRSELNIWLADQKGDTLHWRLVPTAERDMASGNWSARCRVMVGDQIEEPATLLPDGVVVEKRPRQHLGSEKVVPFDQGTAKAAPELPLWRSHKVVRAAKIVNIHPASLNGKPDRWLLEGGIEVVTSFDLQARVGPKDRFTSPIGGYYVRYDDGYESWSPAKAFEEGYTPVSDIEATDPVAAGILAMESLAVAEFEKNWPADDEHAMIRRMCRKVAGEHADRAVYGFPPNILGLINGHIMVAQHGGGIVPSWATYYQMARAALDLVRDTVQPTEAMITAGVEAIQSLGVMNRQGVEACLTAALAAK